MYVCHCRAVSDSTIRVEIELGALDADEVSDRCGAGTRCGSCLDEIRRLCQDIRLEVRSAPLPLAS